MSETWGDVYLKHVKAGCDRSDAAFRADEWQKRYDLAKANEEKAALRKQWERELAALKGESNG